MSDDKYIADLLLKKTSIDEINSNRCRNCINYPCLEEDRLCDCEYIDAQQNLYDRLYCS